ncbi:MAG: decaprenyl-phosphate phosphoribosyltransferase [Planctomycetota bacterium]|jgi:4-hydroxybenzoate polyprenyltransferase
MSPTSTPAADAPLIPSLIRLARPAQWSKSVFLLLGPAYGFADLHTTWDQVLIPALVAVIAFSLTSSASYVFNDLKDIEQDRAHPRKRKRPIATGAVSVRQAQVFGVILYTTAIASLFLLDASVRSWVALWIGLYIINVSLYSMVFKHVLIADVMCLSIGFVLRVVAGCAAVGITPSLWLLNVTFFLSMFLAFGKRLGEQRMLGDSAVSSRIVHESYTSTLLQMSVVVTAVATLLTYTGYIQQQSEQFGAGRVWYWLTVLPATYCLFRCIVLLDAGRFDDPTEIATHDRPFLGSAALFAALTGGCVWMFRLASETPPL